MRTYAKSTTASQSLRLGILLLLEAGSLPALVRLGSLPFLATPGLRLSGWGSWVATTPPADALAAVARLVALVLAGWLLAGTCLYLAGRLARLPGLVRAAGHAVPRPLRRLVDATLAVAVSAAVTAASPAFAAGPPGPPAPGFPAVRVTASAQPPAPSRPAPAPAPRQAPAAPAPGPDTHVVAPGESLWSIAASALAAASPGGSPPDTRQVARYWVEVVAGNRPHLRSGNPNLIFPGEPVTLPPLP